MAGPGTGVRSPGLHSLGQHSRRGPGSPGRHHLIRTRLTRIRALTARLTRMPSGTRMAGRTLTGGLILG
jgi:hypothetical protein